MRYNKKISMALIFCVIIGSIFANITVIVSITPKSIQSNANETESRVIIDKTFDFDLITMTEISEFILTQVDNNNFGLTMIIYSSGLLFESDDTLIIFGHGHLNSENQYFIGDYSENSIYEMVKDKETVALLSCFSSNIKLTNDRQLTYETQIDLVSAMNDLITMLQWEKIASFLPSTNIQLFDLDPGPGGNGWSLSNPPPAFYKKRQAHTFDNYHRYWNLLTDSGIRSLSTYMLNNKWQKIEFTFEGEFLTEKTPNSYYVKACNLKFDSFVITQSDVKDYFYIENIYINGVFQKRTTHTIKIDDVLDAMVSQAEIANRLSAIKIAVAVFVPIGILLLGGGLKLFSIGFAAYTAGVASTSLGLSASCAMFLGSCAAWIGFILLTIAIVLVVAALIITLPW